MNAVLGPFEKLGDVKIYKGVGHAFFNDTRADMYNASAAEEAWIAVDDVFVNY